MQRDDPVLGFNFTVSLVDSASSLAKSFTTVTLRNVLDEPVGGFNECTGLETTLDIHEYEEGGRNGTVLKFPTRVQPGRIVLKRGVTRGTALWEWFEGFLNGDFKRKDGVITLLNDAHEPHTVWGFQRGLPARYSAPQLNAQQSNVAIESIEIVHEGLVLMSGASELATAISSAAGALADGARALGTGVRGAARGIGDLLT
ncbi:MAG: phage tail protein [Pseudomonadota bacterium]